MTRIFTLCGAALLALAGVAQAADPAPAATTKKPDTPMDQRHCLRETGSHIAPKDGHCINAFGEVYTRQDLESTGAITTSQALSKLSPSITTRP